MKITCFKKIFKDQTMILRLFGQNMQISRNYGFWWKPWRLAYLTLFSEFFLCLPLLNFCIKCGMPTFPGPLVKSLYNYLNHFMFLNTQRLFFLEYESFTAEKMYWQKIIKFQTCFIFNEPSKFCKRLSFAFCVSCYQNVEKCNILWLYFDI